jgi:hypothetical protein
MLIHLHLRESRTESTFATYLQNVDTSSFKRKKNGIDFCYTYLNGLTCKRMILQRNMSQIA